MSNQAPAGPLPGLRVLDLSTILAGQLTAEILGDYGADVVTIKHTSRGDGMRDTGWRRESLNCTANCTKSDLRPSIGPLNPDRETV
ncbi:MAG: CoA transferase [Knoellia sp.]